MTKFAVPAVLLLLAALTSVLSAQESSFALLDVSAPNANLHRTRICANFQQFFLRSLPTSPEKAVAYSLGWWNGTFNQLNVCTENTASLTGRIVPLIYPTKNFSDTGKCRRHHNETDFIQTQMDRLNSAKAASALFLLDKGVESFYHIKNYLFSRFYNPRVTNSTPTFYLYKQQFDEIITKVGPVDSLEQLTFRFYRPAEPFLDVGVLVLFALSTGCILIGCLWYAVSLRKKILLGDLKIDSFGHLVSVNESQTSIRADHRVNYVDPTTGEPEKICCFQATGCCLHIFYAVQALILVVVILLLSFFYRPVAVEAFNVFMVIAGAVSLQKCLTPLIRLCVLDPEWTSLARLFSINEERRLERCWIPSWVYKPVRPIASVIMVLAFTFTIIWRLNVDHPLSYLMLDLMNVCICVYSIKASELRSLRLITFFLIGMFVYDIFMVFGTRLFTDNGCSVMVQVVTGVDCLKIRKPDYSHDLPVAPVVNGYSRPPKIPILFYVPLLSNPVGQCFDGQVEDDYQYLMLGLGDVIAPGYLIAFAFYLDVRKMNRYYIYGFTALTGYAFGMISTFVSLKLMATAQPALIYLVPFSLIPLVLVCLMKGTLAEAWKGNIQAA